MLYSQLNHERIVLICLQVMCCSTEMERMWKTLCLTWLSDCLIRPQPCELLSYKLRATGCLTYLIATLSIIVWYHCYWQAWLMNYQTSNSRLILFGTMSVRLIIIVSIKCVLIAVALCYECELHLTHSLACNFCTLHICLSMFVKKLYVCRGQVCIREWKRFER